MYCVIIFNFISVYSTTHKSDKKSEGLDFPESSVGKESACNAGDLHLIAGSGRSPGEGVGYPLQYIWPGEFHGLYV